jgi:putative Holliday junction resolvase
VEAAAAAVAAALARAGGVELVVVGLPLHDDGRESEMSREARAFGTALARATGLRVEGVDETLTSWEAEEGVKARGRRLSKARASGEVDRAAAVAILRSYLRERESSPPSDQPSGG